MASFMQRAVLAAVVLLFPGLIFAAPLAPDELRVSNSCNGMGQLCGMGEGLGVSTHPWFSVVHRASAPRRCATKLRVQVSTSADFATLLWDSGLLAIDPTGPDKRTQAIAYAGPALLADTTYFVRAGVQDDQAHASPFSGTLPTGAVPSFTVRAAFGACDLRVQTNASNALEGNPVTIPHSFFAFTAEYAAAELSAVMAQVQVSTRSNFGLINWDSGWVPIAAVAPGARCAPIPGPSTLSPNVGRFWRIRFKDSTLNVCGWSASRASFVIVPPDPAQPAPAGFGNLRRNVGIFGALASDIELGDLNSDGIADAVVVSENAGESHAVHLSVGANQPGSSLYFGSSSGGRARVALLDFDLDGDLDIAVAQGALVTIYANHALTFTPISSIDVGISGELLELHAADVSWSGWPDLVVSCTGGVSWFHNVGGSFESAVIVLEEEGLLDAAVADLIDDAHPEIVVLAADGMMRVFGIENGYVLNVGTWIFQGASQFAVVQGTASARDIICTNGWQVERRRLNVNSDWETIKSGLLLHGGVCHELLAGDMDGDAHVDCAFLLDTGTLLARQTTSSFVEHEYVGEPQDGAHARGHFGMLNADGALDLIVTRPGAFTQVWFNSARRSVSVLDAVAVQAATAESFIEFEVALNAPAVSHIEVECMTQFEGEGEGDRVPDAASLSQGLSAPSPVVPTTARLHFVPGQQRAIFRVAIARFSLPSVSTMQVQIVAALGAVVASPLATGTIYATGSSSSGPAATAGLQRDWKLRGQINALAQTSNGNTYFGGEFDGVEWAANGVAALDASGNRQRALANLSGNVYATAMDADGSVYVGGKFTLTHQGQLFKNFIKLKFDGSLDAAFRPNPDGAAGDGQVNAIALKAGSVYFGGRFSTLANSAFTFRNIAHVFSSGAYPTRPDRFGVHYVSSPGEPQQQPPEVLTLLIADSGTGSNEFLIVGGRRFNRALTPSSILTVANLALFGLGGTIVPNMPRVVGEVRALAVSNEVFSNWGYGGASRTILFGGNFEWVWYPRMGSNVYETRMHLNSTNFSGELKYGKPASALSHTPVNALLVESGNRLWVGRNSTHMGYAHDPLAIYTISGGGFTISSTFTSGLAMPVRALAAGEDGVLVCGDFSQRATPSGPVPALRALVFSTSSIGTVVSAFRGGFDQPITSVSSARDAQGRLVGFVVGGAFTKLIARRGNLAAMNSAGELLPWGPEMDGPVHALCTDGTDIFIGGNSAKAIGTLVFNRRSLASIAANNDAVNVNSWIADLTGSSCTVRALVVDGTSLVIGGDFAAINGVSRVDAAAISRTASAPSWLAPVTSWNPDLSSATGGAVSALMIDAGIVYLGGSFSGTNSVIRPGLLAVTAPSTGPIVVYNWDAGVSAPCNVSSIAAGAGNIYFCGQFSTVGGQSRSGLAAVTQSGATVTSFAPSANGNCLSLAALPSGVVYIGGTFTSVNGAVRRGVAALDANGGLLSWDASVLGSSSGEVVNVLQLRDTLSAAQLWVAGRFSGTAHAGQHDLTWVSRAWSITTPTLPDANEDQPYGPTGVSLSDNVPCTWALHSPAAPWLQIDASTGAISGSCPLGCLSPIPVLITATQSQNPAVAASRWYLLAVIPKPPPTLVSISGPGSVLEGNDSIVEPAPVVTLTLNQLFAADVHVELAYINGAALKGRDYASLVRTAVIPAGTWHVEIPMCIFGDTILSAPHARDFVVQAIVVTPNVFAHPAANHTVVVILEDDPPQPRHALVQTLHIDESAGVAADPAHVIANQPVFRWSFHSDFAGDQQTGWQMQVHDNAACSGTPVWDSGAMLGTESQVQLGAMGASASLHDGRDYWVRARLWASPTEVSEWRVLAFHTNTPPAAIALHSMTPVGTVHTSRPVLTWDVTPDAEGDRLQFKVTITGASTIDLNSIAQPWIFERYNTASATWESFGQTGVIAGYSKVRLTVPMGSALTAGPWDWTVEVSDGFESTGVAGGAYRTIDVQPAYTATGRVRDAALAPDVGRAVSVYRMPGNTLLGTNVTNANGEFFIPLGGAAQPGDVLAVMIDNPASPPPTYTPAWSAAFIRFGGNDLVQTSGPDRGIELTHCRVSVDSRGRQTLTLADLLDGSGGDPDWPFEQISTQLVLRTEIAALDIEGVLAVLGVSASQGEPSTLQVSGSSLAQQVKIHSGGALLIEQGATVDAGALMSDGCVSIEFGFLAESYGFGWGELAGEGVEEFAQWGADQVDHGDERVYVPVASGPCPCGLEQPVHAFEFRV